MKLQIDNLQEENEIWEQKNNFVFLATCNCNMFFLLTFSVLLFWSETTKARTTQTELKSKKKSSATLTIMYSGKPKPISRTCLFRECFTEKKTSKTAVSLKMLISMKKCSVRRHCKAETNTSNSTYRTDNVLLLLILIGKCNWVGSCTSIVLTV